jgi:hypothetical protein
MAETTPDQGELASPNFSWAELACHDGTPVPEILRPNALALCGLLEALRTLWGGPLLVVSGYRTPTYNLRIGGARNSQHVLGRAADIRPIAVARVPELAALIRAQLPHHPALAALGGWGIYAQWVHVDVRPRDPPGHVAFWEGDGIGAETDAPRLYGIEQR